MDLWNPKASLTLAAVPEAAEAAEALAEGSAWKDKKEYLKHPK